MHKIKQQKKRYRQNVAAVILSHRYPDICEFFVGQRSGEKNRWQFPQGGIDAGETPKEALLRELEEEIGSSNVEIIGEFPRWISYDFPHIATTKKYPFDGQIQKYFLVRLKEKTQIKLDAFDVPEFEAYQFVTYAELFRKVTYFKRRVYRQVIHYFMKEGFI
ncbi:MAG TPA: RNA pyrophosphohydrolase [Epsilonproteobacteria bacterium]|nr:RNA pyrophosphohydrolase [Campylobacterota bacterium]